MKQKFIKYGIFFAFCLLCYFGFTPFALGLEGLQFAGLIVIVPAIILIGSGAWGYFYGFDIIPPILAALLFVPAVYIFMNDSALIYALIYGVVSLAGVGLGTIIRKYAGNRS